MPRWLLAVAIAAVCAAAVTQLHMTAVRPLPCFPRSLAMKAASPDVLPGSPPSPVSKRAAVAAMPSRVVALGPAHDSEAREPRGAGVRAGSSDDNLRFADFVSFLEENGHRGLPHDVSRRTVVEVRDAHGLPVFGADVVVTDGEEHALVQRKTYPDGRALIFPPRGGGKLRVSYAGVSQEVDLAGPRLKQIQLDTTRRELRGRVPLDVAFILDTTGSMGDEIERLKKTLTLIHSQLAHLDPGADVRFGLVEYKDRGDEFVTRVIPFTADLEEFSVALSRLSAGGGGDEPEDVQAGLERALHGLQWRDATAVKVAFLIGDAPPHLDYGEQFTYLSAMQEAARRGIKIAAVSCSGLNLTGEVIWREIAQYTMAPYVFLTRGERGDMDGSPSTVSHHVGPNFVTENLETIVVRVVKDELAPLSQKLIAQRGRR
jgi:Mg-chelatase subunit ChlD